MDHETMVIANALLSLRYGPHSDVANGYIDQKMNYSAWNAISNHVGDENTSPMETSQSSDSEDNSLNNGNGREIITLSPKPSSESSAASDASSDVSSPTSCSTKKDKKDKKNPEERKKRGNLPKDCVRKMMVWLEKNRYNAYPSENTKQDMAGDMGITVRQVSNWFINARRRRLDHILAGEGKRACDFRITRKKKASLAMQRARKTVTKVTLPNDLCIVPPQPQTPPTSCCSTPPSSYESSTDESVFEFRPITPTPTERTLDFASL